MARKSGVAIALEDYDKAGRFQAAIDQEAKAVLSLFPSPID
jgi:hypothetical protein